MGWGRRIRVTELLILIQGAGALCNGRMSWALWVAGGHG